MQPNFIVALMALISSFSQNGKPPVLPPVEQVEVVHRGNQISDLVKDWNRSQGLRLEENKDTQPSVTPVTEVSPTIGEEPTVTVTPIVTLTPTPSRYSTINQKSGIFMPAELLFKAIEHSRTLDFFSGTPYPTPGLNNGNGGNNGNSFENSLRSDHKITR